MNADLIGIYQNILDAQGIQFLLFSKDYSELSKLDYGFRGKIFDTFDYSDFFCDIQKNICDSPAVFFRDDLQLNYCFFEFPKLLKEEYMSDYALIGPVIFQFITKSDLEKLMNKYDFPLSFQKDFLEFYNRIPSLPSYDFWVSLLLPLLRPIFGLNTGYQYIDIADSINNIHLKNNLLKDNMFSSPSFDAIADRYDAEALFFNSVACGNAEEAVENYHKFRQFNISERSLDLLRNQKNWLVILNTNLRQAIYKAQVHPYYIDEISRDFAIKIESANSISQLKNMSTTMIRRYAMLAHNYSTKEYSPLVKACIEHIRFYYYNPITLDILAKHCSVSPGYLSVLFHKETGLTVTDYIQNVRIEHAIFLLNSTSDSIQRIASLCGFSDANYFTRTFKKKKGITPKEYRNSIHT